MLAASICATDHVDLSCHLISMTKGEGGDTLLRLSGCNAHGSVSSVIRGHYTRRKKSYDKAPLQKPIAFRTPIAIPFCNLKYAALARCGYIAETFVSATGWHVQFYE